MKIALETAQPIGGMIHPVNGRYGIRTHLDLYRITTPEFLSMFAIKGNRGFRSSIVGDIAAQDDVVGENHGTKGQDVGTNGCNEDAGDGGMDD
jgi:hypothetical protein